MLPLVARRGGWAKVTKLRHATRLLKRQSLKSLAPLPPPAFLGAPIPIYVVVLDRRVVLPGGRNYWIICVLCTRKAM